MDLISFLLLSIAVFLVYLYVNCYFKRPLNYPPGPLWFLPFVGNAPLLRKLAKECGGQYKALEKLSEDYSSPVVGLKLGNELVVVAFTIPLVREIYSRDEFDGRPDNFFLRLRTMGTRLGVTCTDGPHWNEHRSFVVRHLRQVGYGKTKMEIQIQNELQELLDILEKNDGNPIWPGNQFLPPSVINVLWTFTTGSRIERNDKRLIKFLSLLQKRSKAFDMSGGTLSQMPWLRFFAPEKTGYNLIRNLNKEFYEFFMEIIEEHLKTYSDEKENDDLIYAYIKEMRLQEKNPNCTFTLLQLTMVILDIFIAGSTTTSTTIDLAFMITLMRPDVQEQCHKEIDELLGRNNSPNYANRVNLPYIEAVLLEVQRFFHIVPITGPRRTLKTCQLGGYTLPKNTTVLIGSRSVLMDVEFWKDPETFRPERFLDENRNIIKIDNFLPFGSGRRRCLGDQLARACIFTFFVGILQKYKLQPCPKEPASLNLLPGITLSPKPYKINFQKR